MQRVGRIAWVRARLSFSTRAIVGLLVVMTTSAAAACRPVALTQQIEARRLASELRVQFATAANAANRAVMSDGDEPSAAAVREAEQATQAVEHGIEELQPILKSLAYGDELRALETFRERFAEYRKLDAEILPLAVENTNVKAQRLSFGPAQEAADAFRRSLDAAVGSPPSEGTCCAGAIAAKALAAVLEIQVLQAPHIAEPEDAAMTRMEERMAASESTARKALEELKRLLGAKAGAQLSAASTALDGFMNINREIVTLSRRNSDVRSLALSLGRKRLVTAQCDDQLRALEEALAKHEFTATR
jgi:hypothetical protein